MNESHSHHPEFPTYYAGGKNWKYPDQHGPAREYRYNGAPVDEYRGVDQAAFEGFRNWAHDTSGIEDANPNDWVLVEATGESMPLGALYSRYRSYSRAALGAVMRIEAPQPQPASSTLESHEQTNAADEQASEDRVAA